MIGRLALILCVSPLFITLARPADYTVYDPVPFSTISSFNTTTWQPEKTVAAVGGNILSDTLVLSSDGNTFYVSIPATNLVEAIDRASGKVLQSYAPKYPIVAAPAVLPNGSALFVGTCGESDTFAGCIGGGVEVFDVASAKPLDIISMGSDQVSQIVAAADGATVYVSHYYAPSAFCTPFSSWCPSPVAPAQTSVPSQTLTAIDVATLQVGASVGAPEGSPPESPLAVAITPDGQQAWMLAGEDFIPGGPPATVYGVSLADMTINATIPIATIIWGGPTIAVSPDGSTVATGSNCPEAYCDNILVFINAATQSVFQTVSNCAGNVISLDSSNNAYVSWTNTNYVNSETGAITTVLQGRTGPSAFSSDGKELYILFGAGSAVLSAEAGTSNEGGTSRLFNIASAPMWMAVAANGETLYSAEWFGGLWAFSTATGEVAGQAPISFATAVAVSPDGTTLYMVQFQPNQLVTLDASTFAIENTLPLPGSCYGASPGEAIAVTPSGGQIFAMACGFTWMIDAKTLTIKNIIKGGDGGADGAAVAANPKGGTVYVSTGPSIDIVDTTTDGIIGTIPITAAAIVFSPDGSRAYVESTQDTVSGVAVVDTSTLAVTGFVAGIAPDGGEGLALTPDGSYLYAAGNPGAIVDTQTLQIVGQFQSDGPIVIH
jgi:WD40 repeat protein